MKKQGTVALTAERVMKAWRDGSIDLINLSNGLYLANGRIHYTWVTPTGTTKSSRLRLTRVYLNPRWIQLPVWYQRTYDEISAMNVEELKRIGVKMLGDGEYRLLIYTQVGSLIDLERQICEHILPEYTPDDPQYCEIERRLRTVQRLNEIAGKIRNTVSWKLIRAFTSKWWMDLDEFRKDIAFMKRQMYFWHHHEPYARYARWINYHLDQMLVKSTIDIDAVDDHIDKIMEHFVASDQYVDRK